MVQMELMKRKPAEICVRDRPQFGGAVLYIKAMMAGVVLIVVGS